MIDKRAQQKHRHELKRKRARFLARERRKYRRSSMGQLMYMNARRSQLR